MANPAAQLAPTGKLRVAIAIAPSPSAQFAIKDAAGHYRGVAVILRQALAKKLGVPVELVVHNGSGEIQNSAADNKWDVAFLPVDEERKKFVDFGNAYHLLQSTYLVGPSSKIASVAAANTAGVRIGGVANTATFRTSNKTAPNATHVSFDKTDAALAALRERRGGRAGVLARVAHRIGAESARLAHSRRRLFEFDHLGGGAEGQAGRAGLRHRVHRGSESLRPGAPGVRRDGAEFVAGRTGGDEELAQAYACFSGVRTTSPSSSSETLIWHDSREFGRTS